MLLTATRIDQLERLDGEAGGGGKARAGSGGVELTEQDIFDKEYLTEEEVCEEGGREGRRERERGEREREGERESEGEREREREREREEFHHCSLSHRGPPAAALERASGWAAAPSRMRAAAPSRMRAGCGPESHGAAALGRMGLRP